MSEEKKKKPLSVRTQVAILRDEVATLKAALGPLFDACDEGLVAAYAHEKEPERLGQQSLEQVRVLKSRIAATLEAFWQRFELEA